MKKDNMKIKEQKVIDFFNKNKKDKRLQGYKIMMEEYDFSEYAIWSIEYIFHKVYCLRFNKNIDEIDKEKVNEYILKNTNIGELLDISTLEARNSDRLDFQEYSNGLIENAILKILKLKQ